MDSHFIRELKERIPIAEVVGEYVRLRKTGSNLVGLCPFHSERSPSFSVSDKKKIFHCFGCQKSGDVISFIQEIQAVSFVDALKILAHKYGLTLPAEFSKTPSGAAGTESPDAKNQIFYKLNHFVAQFYHERLMSPEGALAREYLQSRGISEETIRIEKLGFASQAWSDLTDFLIQKKAPLEVAESLGLIRKSDKQNKPYDFFRNRVIFPVLDMRGRVIAFGGRKLGMKKGPNT